MKTHHEFINPPNFLQRSTRFLIHLSVFFSAFMLALFLAVGCLYFLSLLFR